MTPADEWDATPDPHRLLALLCPRVELRRLRLAAVGYVRHSVHRRAAGSLMADLRAIESRAEAGLTDGEFRTIQRRLGRHRGDATPLLRQCFARAWWVARSPVLSGNSADVMDRLSDFRELGLADAIERASVAAGPCPPGVRPDHPWHTVFRDAYLEALAPKTAILRCVFPNPYRPPPDAAPWRTATAVALAEQAYESRDFAAQPVLADALQDAGCDDDHVLSHLRGPGPHARGCWALDLVLGRV